MNKRRSRQAKEHVRQEEHHTVTKPPPHSHGHKTRRAPYSQDATPAPPPSRQTTEPHHEMPKNIIGHNPSRNSPHRPHRRCQSQNGGNVIDDTSPAHTPVSTTKAPTTRKAKRRERPEIPKIENFEKNENLKNQKILKNEKFQKSGISKKFKNEIPARGGPKRASGNAHARK